jgi:hypothetical protein
MFDFSEEMKRRAVEKEKRKANRWPELQALCDVLNGGKAHTYALQRAWQGYRQMVLRHDAEMSQFLHEVQDGGWGTSKNPSLGRVGISRKIGRALRALIEHGSSHLKTCHCGTKFVAKRRGRKHCSERCKQAVRLTNDYRKQKAAYMRGYRKTLETMSRTSIRFEKRKG